MLRLIEFLDLVKQNQAYYSSELNSPLFFSGTPEQTILMTESILSKLKPLEPIRLIVENGALRPSITQIEEVLTFMPYPANQIFQIVKLVMLGASLTRTVAYKYRAGLTYSKIIQPLSDDVNINSITPIETLKQIIIPDTEIIDPLIVDPTISDPILSLEDTKDKVKQSYLIPILIVFGILSGYIIYQKTVKKMKK